MRMSSSGKLLSTSEVVGSHTEKQFLPKSSEIYPFQTTLEEKSWKQTGPNFLFIKIRISIHMNCPKFKIEGVHVTPLSLQKKQWKGPQFLRKTLNYCPRTHMIQGHTTIFGRKPPSPLLEKNGTNRDEKKLVSLRWLNICFKGNCKHFMHLMAFSSSSLVGRKMLPLDHIFGNKCTFKLTIWFQLTIWFCPRRLCDSSLTPLYWTVT